MNAQLAVEILTILGSVAASLTAILGTFWWIVKRYYQSRLEEIEILKEKNNILSENVRKMASANTDLADEKKRLQERVKRAQQTEQELGEMLDQEKTERACEFAKYDEYRANFKRSRDGLDAEILDLRTKLKEKSLSHDHLQVVRARIRTISSLDGKLWNRPILQGTPAYRPRTARETRIISILNLKGGVGKTTITANLGAALAENGNVLMVDLDFQRSLSRLTLSDKERTLRHYAKRCVQHLLTGARRDLAALIEIVGDPIDEPKNCWILPNSDSVRDHSSDSENTNCEDDSLEETEMRLMFNWIFEPNPTDIRFHLREALHSLGIDDYFNYVLLDCPPRLTTACINALAASDYVLIPVTLDAMATNSVPYLLKSLDFLRNVLPQLEVLGVVANKVNMTGGNLVSQEGVSWERIQNTCRNVSFFSTKIKDDAAIGKFATQSIEEDKRTLRLTKPYEKTKKCFVDLASEVEKVIATREGRSPTSVTA
jgi:cellulose biosynthesis protein BcsQ